MTEPAPDPLDTAGALRVPVFERDTSPKLKADALEEFILVSAHWSAELHALRRELREEMEPLTVEWALLEGWEVNLRGKTNQSVEDAKRQARPDLWKTMHRIRQRGSRLSEEIARLDRDFEKASRAYTIISGPT